MKTSVARSNSSSSRAQEPANRSVYSAKPRPKKNLTVIHCGFCQNTFAAVPRQAVCAKCKRPANRPLTLLNKFLCLAMFPFGLIKAVLLRPSQPYAAAQALLLSLAGGGLWAAIYFGVLQSRG